MTDRDQFRRLALALADVTEAPHFDRVAYKVRRIFATVAADGLTANFKFAPDEQALKCAVAPDAFAPVGGAWGAQGWTTCTLAALGADELADALRLAHAHAVKKSRPASRR